MIPSIGFDFDDCIANAYSITPFVIILERLIPAILSKQPSLKTEKIFLQKSRVIFYQRLAENEIATKGTILRPSILRIMPKLLELKGQGNINHMFIYSNNSSAEIIDVVDHIMALVLRKPPYNVHEFQLVKDTNGFLHTLAPRFHLDSPCRNLEIKTDGFREKSLDGINACLGESIDPKDLWFLDDKRYHEKLMNKIKENYITVEEYRVHLSNKRLAEIFIESYPADAFKPNTRIGSLFLTEINRLMPGFRPTGFEARDRLVEKFTAVLRGFSPDSGGRAGAVWKEDHVNADLKFIEKGLNGAMNPVESNTDTTNMNKPLTYTNPIGGSLIRKTRKTRRLRKRR